MRENRRKMWLKNNVFPTDVTATKQVKQVVFARKNMIHIIRLMFSFRGQGNKARVFI